LPTNSVQSLQCSTYLLFPPTGSKCRSRKGQSNRLRSACLVLFLAAATAIAARAQNFTTLHSFDGADGSGPEGTLIQGLDGNFYGTTTQGGANAGGGSPDGTIYKITPQGTLTVLHSFCSQTGCPGGAAPFAGLLLGHDGNFYGTANGAGTFAGGTVFKISAQGTFTTLYNFCQLSLCPDGSSPTGGLAQGTDGNFYGTTFYGGANNDGGTVFKITPQGSFTTLYSFCAQANCVDGWHPQAGLVQGSDGNLYGTTFNGGANGGGTVFKITPQGKRTTLYGFCSQANCTDGENPYAGVIQAADGNFYGTTLNGGNAGSFFGTVFKITPQGALTTLYSFCSQNSCADGYSPYAGLFQGTDGNFYGTTNTGGAYFEGTIFEITPQGTLTTLFSFCAQSKCSDGGGEVTGVVEATNGKLYGTTLGGGAYQYGTVFSLSAGLGPFVQMLPASGKVGAAVKIQGTNLTGTTAVSFHGTAATFTVVSGTLIKTTVPSGATTGTVKVTTPHGVLTSNKTFRVTPQILSFSPPSGPVGTTVTITGVSLTQTSKVTFGAVKATVFSVISDTQVTAAVPTGAVTGKIGVTTPGGTALSATSFTVTP
jgi:uncharacterized repeat protein (TIGR03803 family)